MSYELKFAIDDKILRVEIFGDRLKDGHQLKTASHEDLVRNCAICQGQADKQALGRFPWQGKCPTVQAYEINSTLAACGVERNWQIAFVCLDAKSQTNIKFAETVAVNRGFNVGVFSIESDARTWLNSP